MVCSVVDPDPHSFSLLDPDPGGKNLKITNNKNARKLVPVIIVILLQILMKIWTNSKVFFYF